MPLDLVQQSFNAGEWSPRLDGRSDLEKYYSACRISDNMIPTRYGPSERRPGLYYVAEVKDSSKKTRLLPFKYSTVQAYIIEAGDEYMRFYKDRGQIQAGTGTQDLIALDNIVAHWLLDDNLATQAVLDDDGNTHDGVMVGTTNTEDVHKTGKVGTGCFNFNGVDSVDITNHADFNFDDKGDGLGSGTDMSIIAWIYVDLTGGWQRILTKADSNKDEWSFAIEVLTNKLWFRIKDESTIKFALIVSDATLTQGWHLVCITYEPSANNPWDGDTAADYMKLYIDGALVDSTATTDAGYDGMENLTADVVISGVRSGGNLEQRFDNRIDNVAIFSDVLTAAEIVSLYNLDAYEISSPYLEADLFGLQRIQSADVMYAFHSDYNPRKLKRFAHNDWELENITFDWPPFLDENTTDITITPTGAGAAPLVVGTAVTLTASASLFTNSHIDSYWLIKHPRTADETVAPNKVTSTEANGFFDAAGEVSGSLKDVEGSWNFRTTGIWTGQLVVERSYDEGTSWHTIGKAFTSQDDQNFNVSGEETLGNAWLRIRAVEPDGTFAWIAAGGTPDACVATLTVERYYHYGIVKITAFTSATVVTAEVVRAINSESATKLWSEGAWSDERGYPSCGVFHEERLMTAGTTFEPHRLWGSRTFDWENFRTGTLDDHSVKYDMNAGEMNAVRWLISKEVLLLGTAGAEWKLGSFDADEPLTPGNPIKPRVQTTYGSKSIQAIMLANVVLFVVGGQSESAPGRVVRGAQYIFEKGESGGYDAPDYTTLAEHITESGIVSMAYQQQPEPVLWCVLDNGKAIGMTFEPGQKVWGWFPVVTEGLFEDVGVIPGVTEDEIWWIVNRTINGSTKRYIEYFKPRDWGSDQKDCFFVDSGLTFDGGDAVTITGITKADPAVVTMSTYPTDGDGNNLEDGDQVRIRYVGGMSEVNNKVFTISNPNTAAKTFELRDKLDTVDINSTGFTAFSSSVSGDTTYGSVDIKNVSTADIAKLALGAPITAVGIPSGATITAIKDNWFTMSDKATVTDTAVTITIGGTVEQVDNTFFGFEHLVGKTISILGDGSVHKDVAVPSSGTIVLTEYYNKVHGGLPYNSDLMPMKLEVQTQSGSGRAKIKRINSIIFSFYKSLGCTFGTTTATETIPFRKTTDAMGKAVPLFTGEKELGFPGGYELSGDIFVRQSQPLPLTVRSITPRLQLYGQ